MYYDLKLGRDWPYQVAKLNATELWNSPKSTYKSGLRINDNMHTSSTRKCRRLFPF